VPFALPQGWAWARLPEICSIPITDGTHQTPVYTTKELGIPFLSSKDVVKHRIDWSDTSIKYITKELHEKLYARVAPRQWDILLAKNGTTGVAALVEDNTIFDIYVTLAILRPQKLLVIPSYLLHVINSPFCKSQFNDHLTGIGLPNLHLTDIRKTLIPLPPVAEQKRIVTKIDELFTIADSLGEAADSLEETSKRLGKKILDLAIRGKLVSQDPNDEPASELVKRIAASHKSPCKNQGEPVVPPFVIPDSWEWVRLGSITNYGQCKSIDAKAISPDTWSLDLEEIEKDTGRLLVRRTAAEKKSSSSKHIFCRGMVLYSKLRTYLNKVLVADMDGVCTSEIVPISVFDGVSPEYLRLVLTSQYFLQYTAARGYGVKMPRVGTNDMCSAPIPLPPLDEQKRIVKRVEELKATTRTLVAL
jgi:type I restriction enzyme S subunit